MRRSLPSVLPRAILVGASIVTFALTRTAEVDGGGWSWRDPQGHFWLVSAASLMCVGPGTPAPAIATAAGEDDGYTGACASAYGAVAGAAPEVRAGGHPAADDYGAAPGSASVATGPTTQTEIDRASRYYNVTGA